MYGLYRISWGKIAAWLGVTAFLLWHPFTRRIVWAILPLGTKPDDLVFIAGAIVVLAVVILTIRGVVHNNLIFRIFASLFFNVKKKNEEMWDRAPGHRPEHRRWHD